MDFNLTIMKASHQTTKFLSYTVYMYMYIYVCMQTPALTVELSVWSCLVLLARLALEGSASVSKVDTVIQTLYYHFIYMYMY